jgi:rod shape-determining protein MreD
MVVGYVAGRLTSGPSRPMQRLGVAAASSFVGTSVFALSGILFGDPIGIPELLEVIVVAMLWDVLLTPFVLPPVMALFRRLEPDRSLARENGY